MKTQLFVLSIFVLILTSCVSPLIYLEDSRKGEDLERDEIVRAGMGYLGKRDLADENDVFRNDCSGFVLGLYRTLGYSVTLKHYTERWVTENLYRTLHSRGHIFGSVSPLRGDLAFFKNTIPDSGNRVTHVGMVSDVLDDGTVVLVHYSSQGVSLLRMNLRSPHSHQNGDGEVLNDFLRKDEGAGEATSLLSGELFYSYGDLYSYVRQR
jgi:hypothetical protein